jgi:hypothetical protein
MNDTTPVSWPPGWYHDPAGAELLRWWDGTSWTDRTVTPQELPTPSRSTAARSPTSDSPRHTRLSGRLAVATAVGIALTAVVVVHAHLAPNDTRRSATAGVTTLQHGPEPSPGTAALTVPSTPPWTPPSTPRSTRQEQSVPAQRPAAARTFTDGTFRVPRDVSPGVYHTINRLDDCEWYRWARVGGTTALVGQGIGDDGPAVATILPGDVQFRSVDCGRWTAALTGPSIAATQFEQGTFRVGVDIAPGTYATSGPTGCIWRRLSGFTGAPDAVIAQGHPSHPTTVRILPTDQGFYTIHCGQWHRA